MRNNGYRQGVAMDLAAEIIGLNRALEQQESLADKFELKAAMYKAYFFNNHDLAEKLCNQIEENHNNRIGEFDGFCYASWRAQAVYRSLSDMYEEGIITEAEYRFCKV